MIALLQKPEKGGTPAVDSEPMAEVMLVAGIREPRPPIEFMSVVLSRCSRAAELTNRRLLAMQWLNRWNTTPARASGLPQPRPSTMSVSYTHLRAHETVLDIVCR